MIYYYEDTAKKVTEWLNLDMAQHTKKRELFTPDRSINNTQTWKRFPQSRAEVEYIEQELKEYLYAFPTH